jgi:CheY-like chemotaxis protein
MRQSQARELGRVLVVDDDEVIRRLIAVNLALEGFDVATAVDGHDCLEKVSAIAPDVITLDVVMPCLDGWETARRLRKCPDTAHIKLVLITAYGQVDNPARYRDARADAYLAKPFDPAEMIRVIRALTGADAEVVPGSGPGHEPARPVRRTPPPPARPAAGRHHARSVGRNG